VDRPLAPATPPPMLLYGWVFPTSTSVMGCCDKCCHYYHYPCCFHLQLAGLERLCLCHRHCLVCQTSSLFVWWAWCRVCKWMVYKFSAARYFTRQSQCHDMIRDPFININGTSQLCRASIMFESRRYSKLPPSSTYAQLISYTIILSLHPFKFCAY